MCKFCENITDEKSEFIWVVRNAGAEDNICEFVNNNTCDECNGCANLKFGIRGYNIDGNVRVGISFYQNILSYRNEDVVINPYSETQQFNFCPFCGKQISKDVVSFNEAYRQNIIIKEK
jgi:hypothetical protein